MVVASLSGRYANRRFRTDWVSLLQMLNKPAAEALALGSTHMPLLYGGRLGKEQMQL